MQLNSKDCVLVADWEVDKTISDNETMTIVFSDTGHQFAGCGNFDGAFFKTKPIGEEKSLVNSPMSSHYISALQTTS